MNKDANDVPPVGRIGREPLPTRRRNITVAAAWIDVHGIAREIKVSPGFYKDGRMGEVFAATGKPDSTLDTMLDEWSQLLSRFMQRGGTVAEIARGIAFRPDGRAETPLGAVVKTMIELEALR